MMEKFREPITGQIGMRKLPNEMSRALVPLWNGTANLLSMVHMSNINKLNFASVKKNYDKDGFVILKNFLN